MLVQVLRPSRPATAEHDPRHRHHNHQALSKAQDMARAWEQYGPLHPGYAADFTESGFDSSSDAEVAPSTEEAGEHLAELLVNLRLRGYLSAKQCCIIA